MRIVIAVLCLFGMTGFLIGGISSGTVTPPPPGTGIVSIGDSITAFGPPTGYPYLLSVDKSLPLDNRAIGRYEACWMNQDQIFPALNPLATGNPVYTMMAGTNDEVVYGASPGSPGPIITGHEGLFVNCLWAAMAWLGTPNTAKTIPSTCAKTGTWTVLTDFFLTNQAVRNDNLGDTITCTINVVNGVIYVWFHLGYDFFYSIDGGANVQANFPYSLSLNNTINVLRVTGLSNGSHTIRITNNWGASGFIMGPMGTGTVSSCCRVMLSNIIREQNNSNATVNQTYSNLAVTARATMAGDGLQIVAVDARSRVDPVTEMVDQLHPNATGLRHIADAFEAVW